MLELRGAVCRTMIFPPVRIMPKLLAIVAVTLLVLLAAGGYYLSSAAEGYSVLTWWRAPAPDQPIAFYHSVHAGENQIPCMYCHYTADQSKSAGIPSVKLCVGCHIAGSTAVPPDQVAGLTFPVQGQGAERPEWWYEEAGKILTYWREQRPIPWVKVHDLPEHASFPHYSHVNVGLECQTCHGPVEEMEKVYQFSSLQMGWCIDCHEGESELSAEEEARIAERSSYRRRLAALEAEGVDVSAQKLKWPNQRASIDCTVCHY